MKKVLSLLLSALIALSMVGCGETDTNGDNTSEEGSHYVGFSVMTLSDSYLVDEGEKLKKMCEEQGYKCTVMGAEGVAATQVTQIENMITEGCDIILICPIDIDALHDVIKKANDAGVAVCYIGTPFEGDEDIAVALTADQYDFGYQAAVAASNWVDENYPDAADGSIEAAIFKNTSAALFVQRAQGMEQIETLNSKIKVVEEYDLVGQDNANAKVQEYTDQLLMAHPNVQVIISHSSDYGTAINEVIARTSTVDPSNMGIFSDDWLESAADLIRDDSSAFRALVDAGEMCDQMLKAALAKSEGGSGGSVSMGLTIVTKDNVDEQAETHSY